MSECTLCPRNCKVNREKGELGFCGAGSSVKIARASLHYWEEPCISGKDGSGTVFFACCNMKCVYCQNYQISQPQSVVKHEITDYETVVNQIVAILQKNVNFLGFVSPTSHIPHMLKIIDMVQKHGFSPKIIYNTNGYENVETLRLLEGIVDIYLPDFKYADDELAQRLSGIPNYTETALAAIGEMYRQKKMVLNDENPALIIRHLVLPNHVDNSLNVLNLLAKEISTDVFVSLMSQYFPVYKALELRDINRTLSNTEYDSVLEKLDDLWFERGWTQQLDSNDYYQPDFDKENPFL